MSNMVKAEDVVFFVDDGEGKHKEVKLTTAVNILTDTLNQVIQAVEELKEAVKVVN